MGEVTTIGLDLAKHVFQVHGVDASGTVVLRKQLRRGQVVAFFAALPRCLVGLEACATAHHWARELQAVGHEVRLMPAQYVKAYVRRNKNDAADAEAICEAVGRPSMRFARRLSSKPPCCCTVAGKGWCACARAWSMRCGRIWPSLG
jgi:transposase